MVAVAGCADLFAPPLAHVVLSIIPAFDAVLAGLAAEADQLRIVVERDSSGSFLVSKDTTVAIDPVTGEATARISVALVRTPQAFRVRLEGRRSSDGVVLYRGIDTILVSEGSDSTAATVTIPVSYAGPRATRLVLAPSDTALQPGRGFTFRVATFDQAGQPLQVPVRFGLVVPADSTALRVDARLGVVTTSSTVTQALVLVYARTLEDAGFVADTSLVAVGAVPDSVRVGPGFLNVAGGSTGTLRDSVFSRGVLLPVRATWVSRATAVATVDASGVVTGVAPGTAVVAATATGAAVVGDSVSVVVPPAGNVVVRTVANGRSFRRARVGDTVTVDLLADMQFTPNEKLGSYNATLTWDAAVLTFLDVQNGTFAAPTVNSSNVSAGELRLGAADANGQSGNVAVARVRFRAAQAGSTVPTVVISEMSAAVTFTNLINRVTVANGHVTVRQ